VSNQRLVQRLVTCLAVFSAVGASATQAPSVSASAATTTRRSATRSVTTKRAVKPAKPTSTVTKPTVTKPTVTKATTAVTTVVVPTSKPVTGELQVFAASSLTAAFTDIGRAFEKVNPGASVTFNFAGSSTLVTQIQNGAPADVFASADNSNIDKLVSAKIIEGSPTVFTKNRLMIVVPKGNPLRVKTLNDLSRSEVYVALGAPGVPAGDYARQILTKAGVEVTPKTLESSVAAIVNKAALKEIDAGIVYVTDVARDDYRVDGVTIPDAQNVIALYPIGALSNAKNRPAAAAFVAFTQSAVAQEILTGYQFASLK
jgi:molybdate transport system substrate-binding protein